MSVDELIQHLTEHNHLKEDEANILRNNNIDAEKICSFKVSSDFKNLGFKVGRSNIMLKYVEKNVATLMKSNEVAPNP